MRLVFLVLLAHEPTLSTYWSRVSGTVSPCLAFYGATTSGMVVAWSLVFAQLVIYVACAR